MRAVVSVGPVLLGAVLSVNPLSPCEGVTRHVPSEFATLQAALDASALGDTVLVAAGTYTDVETRDIGGFPFTSCAFLADGVTLRSEAGAEMTTIDMQDAPGPQPQVVMASLLASSKTSVQGFTITGAPTGGRGARVSFSGRVTFLSCIFRNLDANTGSGGGIAGEGDLTIVDCLFQDCLAYQGGAILHSGGNLDMRGTTIQDCGHRGVYLLGVAGGQPESASIDDCVFLDNWSGNSGGGLYVFRYDAGVAVSGCRFERNVVDITGGAIQWDGFGEKTLEGCVFVENGALGSTAVGGAVRISGNGACSIEGNTFYANYTGNSEFDGGTIDLLASVVFGQNIVAASSGGAAIGTTSPLGGGCNVFWMNENGNGVPLSKTDQEDDPLFCNVEVGDFTVQVNSPCVEPQSGGCGQIGAFPAACGFVAIERTSWGQIKGRFRQGEGR